MPLPDYSIHFGAGSSAPEVEDEKPEDEVCLEEELDKLVELLAGGSDQLYDTTPVVITEDDVPFPEWYLLLRHGTSLHFQRWFVQSMRREYGEENLKIPTKITKINSDSQDPYLDHVVHAALGLWPSRPYQANPFDVADKKMAKKLKKYRNIIFVDSTLDVPDDTEEDDDSDKEDNKKRDKILKKFATHSAEDTFETDHDMKKRCLHWEANHEAWEGNAM